jgi:hypothetical protein
MFPENTLPMSERDLVELGFTVKPGSGQNIAGKTIKITTLYMSL